jgi:hypothetical protein
MTVLVYADYVLRVMLWWIEALLPFVTLWALAGLQTVRVK